ncbi:hypothetical protein [Asticcacaulis sp. MM231]|uniref:hypothetical protein n=1 Tax=Asticcacaulis sp. MM231 TaxID=3157666 RepID=UPI0032D572B7
MLRDSDQPKQASRNRANPAMFDFGGYHYDIVGKPFFVAEAAPGSVRTDKLMSALRFISTIRPMFKSKA